MDFSGYLQTSAKEIEETIGSFKNEWTTEIEKVSPKLTKLTDIFTQAWEGGKRLRGALIKLGYEITSSHPNPDILKIAAAYEIFQTAILAHDDIVDLSPTRRGKPTLYRLLGGDHYGISQTICLGDIGFFLATKLISDTNFPAEQKIEAISQFSKMFVRTALGEMLDIELPRLKSKRAESDVITIQKLKTADYTISYPLIIGAVLGGAKPPFYEIIRQFGTSLGIAFQIQDDILGVFGDERTLGKSVTSDVEEGKNTLLITYALDHANAKQHRILAKFYGTGPISQPALDQVKKVFTDTGALDYSRQKALKYVNAAKKIIPQISKESKYQQLLEQMAVFLVERNK